MKYVLITFCLAAAFCLGACQKQVKMTTIGVADSLRHYYPVVMGKQLELNYYVENTGKEPLVITEIQPSCGCIFEEKNDDKRVLPPGGKLHLAFTYDSNKNLGYVRHTIRLFGNIAPKGMAALVFDVNVVPSSDYIRDYEEIYNDQQTVGTLVDGHENNYYIETEHGVQEGHRNDYEREHNQR